MMHFLGTMLEKKMHLPARADALKGRAEPVETAKTHFVNGRSLHDAAPQGYETIFFAMGQFWGPERLFWKIPGVWTTAAGYMGGFTPNPTYPEILTGMTGHAQAVRVVFDPQAVGLDRLLAMFWERHDPTQGNRQGSEIGTFFRSAIYVTGKQQHEQALASRTNYQQALAENARGRISTDIAMAGDFYFAETDHQQYLARNPGGPDRLGGTGVAFPHL